MLPSIFLLAAVCGDDIHRFHEKAKSSQDAVGGFSLFFLVNKRSVEFSVETILPRRPFSADFLL
jgi:hypothetical protein